MPRFLILLLAYTLSQFFRSFLAVIAPELSKELNLSPADLGNVSAIWFMAFALAQLYVGWSLDRIGPRFTMAGMMTAAVAGSLVLAGSHGLGGCLAGMALIGIGCAPIYMGSLFLFARSVAGAGFALRSSLLLGLGSAGNLLGTTPLAYASQTVGWRMTFVGIALATTLSAGLIAWLVRDPVRAEPAPGEQDLIGGLLKIISLRDLWPILPITLVSYAVILAERGLWVGPFLADVHQLGAVPRGNVVLIMATAMALGALAYGPVERLGLAHKSIVIAGSAVTGLLLVVLAMIGDRSILVAAILLALIGAAGMTYVQLIAHARLFFPEGLLGRGMATMNLLYFGGAGLLQPLSGLLVGSLKGQGLAPSAVYGDLHFGFGALLLAATAIYLFAKRQPG
jgi:MFS family permease